MEINFKKIGIRLLFSVLILFVMIVTIHLIKRKNELNNNDLLMHYEEYEPIITVSDNRIRYEYILEYGTVIHNIYKPTNTEQLVISDEKRGWVKQYNDHVLFTASYKQTDEICDFLSLPYHENHIFNSLEECEQLKQLLDEEKYDIITSVWKRDIITTPSGTIYIQ